MRDRGGGLSFAPRLPSALTRLAFRVTFRGRSLMVEVTPKEARYSLLAGEALRIHHHGRALSVPAGKSVTRAIPSIKAGARPEQPPGREPQRRRPAP